MRKKPSKCTECRSYKERSNMGFCSKFKWEIAPSLAKRQAVCSEDDELAEEIEMVTVLTPCGHKTLISKEGYEEDMKNPDAQFWRPLKSVNMN